MDTANSHKAAMMRLVSARTDTLYRSIGVSVKRNPDSAAYYAELDLEVIGGEIYGPDFVEWVLKKIKPGEMLFRIADESGVVLMPGGGFGDTHPSARVSLANLNEYEYAAIGKAIRKLLDGYNEECKAQKKG